jgi:hypothetical protein
MEKLMADERDFVRVTDLEDLWVWVFFTMGGVSQAAFVASGDGERDKRSRQAALNLGRLVPAIAAALTVARNHREEFDAELAQLAPVELERPL